MHPQLQRPSNGSVVTTYTQHTKSTHSMRQTDRLLGSSRQCHSQKLGTATIWRKKDAENSMVSSLLCLKLKSSRQENQKVT